MHSKLRKHSRLKKYKRSFVKRVRLFLSTRFFIKKVGAFQFLLDSINSVDRRLDTEGFWEKDQVCYLKKLVRHHQCSKFFDVGALWGYYSIEISENTSIKNTYLFEPSEINRAQLFGNLFINQLADKMEVFPFAISSFDGHTNFSSYQDRNRGRHGIQNSGEKVVEVRMMDSLFDFKEENLAFKIDVEGSEINVINGMMRLLKNNRCVLQIESYPINFDELEKLLLSVNYIYDRSIAPDHYFLRKDMI